LKGNPRRALGDFAERVAAEHLASRGYAIRDRNVRTRYGEIDLIAEKGDLVAFVEVRCRRGGAMGSAIESLSWSKQARLVALAEAYGQEHPELPGQWRIDLIALDLAADGRVLCLRHVEGAVEG
jgi:putative endonuclease